MRNIFLTITGYLILNQSIADPCIQHPLFNTFQGFEQNHCEAREFDKIKIQKDIESLAYNLNFSEKQASTV